MVSVIWYHIYFNPRSPRGGATAAALSFIGCVTYFNPRSPRGGATISYSLVSLYMHYFNPRSPRGGATPRSRRWSRFVIISIHAPHEGERHLTQTVHCLTLLNFNPRSPRGGATRIITVLLSLALYISIHAPHEGERHDLLADGGKIAKFQSTLPTRGSDCHMVFIILKIYIFQSTLPTRGSDAYGLWATPRGTAFQSTLPTRGSDHQPRGARRTREQISIHAPHEGERQSIFRIHA